MLIRFRSKAFVCSNSSIFHCNGSGFRCQYLYSSTSSTHLLVSYLVDSLGFSKQEAASTSSKITSSKTLNNPDLLINYLKQIGLDNTQMKKLVNRVPKLLLSDVSKTLKPKFQCLMDLGLSVLDLVNVISKDTQIVERGLDTHLRPIIDCLRRILGSDEDVVEAIKRAPWLFSFGAHHKMETNLLLVRNFGFTDEKIRKFVLVYPSCLTLKPEKIDYLLHRMENDFQFSLDSPMFPYGFLRLASQRKSTLDRKIGIFKSFGLSNDDVLMMFRKLPASLYYFMKKLGLGPAYLVSHPAILTYSLDKRVVPQKLERRKLALYSVVMLTEKKFREYFVLPYKDQIPNLYEPLKKIVAP
ncbi:unnamed protein product [Withania somnifera]